LPSVDAETFGYLARRKGPTESSSSFDNRGRAMREDSESDFEQLLSPEDVARACGLSRRAVYRAIARGELRAARLCHRLRVRPVELERWIAEQTPECPAPPLRETGRSTAGFAGGGLRALLDEAEG
jgi:excisionase family DNA binding protein